MVKADNTTVTGSLDYIFIAGPISLDSRNNLVYIVPDKVIELTQNEFDSLYLLAVRENITISFEIIYDAVWEKDDGIDRREEAVQTLFEIAEKINKSGNDFVRIDCHPSFGFTLRTKWGHNRESWQQTL